VLVVVSAVAWVAELAEVWALPSVAGMVAELAVLSARHPKHSQSLQPHYTRVLSTSRHIPVLDQCLFPYLGHMEIILLRFRRSRSFLPVKESDYNCISGNSNNYPPCFATKFCCPNLL